MQVITVSHASISGRCTSKKKLVPQELKKSSTKTAKTVELLNILTSQINDEKPCKTKKLIKQEVEQSKRERVEKNVRKQGVRKKKLTKY